MRRAPFAIAVLGLLVFGAYVAWDRQDLPPHQPDALGVSAQPVGAIAPTDPMPQGDVRAAEAAAASSEAAEAERNSAALPSTTERARQWLAHAVRPSGDNGIDFLLTSVERVLDRPVKPSASLPTAEDLMAEPYINPLGQKLSADELKDLNSMIADYRTRLDQLEHDSYIEQQMALASAIGRSDFFEVPNGNWPEGLKEKLQTMVFARFRENERDRNQTLMPGRDLSHQRFMMLGRQEAQDYFAVLDRKVTTKAEFNVAVRTFFLQRR